MSDKRPIVPAQQAIYEWKPTYDCAARFCIAEARAGTAGARDERESPDQRYAGGEQKHFDSGRCAFRFGSAPAGPATDCNAIRAQPHGNG